MKRIVCGRDPEHYQNTTVRPGARETFHTTAPDHANCSVGSLTHGFLSLEEAGVRSATLEHWPATTSGWATSRHLRLEAVVQHHPHAAFEGPMPPAVRQRRIGMPSRWKVEDERTWSEPAVPLSLVEGTIGGFPLPTSARIRPRRHLRRTPSPRSHDPDVAWLINGLAAKDGIEPSGP